MAPDLSDFKTERLRIHLTAGDDLAALMALWNDGRVMKWVGYPDGLGYDLPQMVDWHTAMSSNPLRHHFVVESPDEGFCGELYYDLTRLAQFASLDIKFRPEVQRHGLATEAFRALIDLVFASEADVIGVYTEPNPENRASQRLYLRCGLKPEPRPRALPPAESFFALRRADWELTAYRNL